MVLNSKHENTLSSDGDGYNDDDDDRCNGENYTTPKNTGIEYIKLFSLPPHLYRNSFIHLAVCLTTGPKPLPTGALHIVRSRTSSFKWEYPLLYLRSSSSFLRFLPRLPVTSIFPFIFPSITRCRRQFIRKMWPIQLAFPL